MLDTLPEQSESLSGTATVLLVEPDPVLSELLAVCLRDDGYAVVAAQDGAEAIRILVQRHPPNCHSGVVLLDIHPAEAGARQVLQYLAGLSHPVPVVAVGADPLTLATVASSGPVALTRPIDWGHWRAVMARYCRSGPGYSPPSEWRGEQEPDRVGSA